MNYTLVIYKSDGCNTCRGCVMEQWGSEFDLDVCAYDADVVNKVSEAFTRWSDGGSYVAYAIGVIPEKRDKYDNGLIVPAEKVVYEFQQYGSDSWRQQPGGVSVLSYHDEANYDEVVAEGNRLNKLIREKVAQTIADQRAAAERAKDAEKEQKRIEQEKQERQQLAALQQKYGKE